MNALSAAWAMTVLGTAALGWGIILELTVLRPRRFSGAQRILLGMCAEVAIGGWLNLLHAISPRNVIVLLALGVVAAVHNAVRDHGRLPRRGMPGMTIPEWTVTGLLTLMLGNQFLGLAAAHSLMFHDDLQAYLLFPVRAMQTGSLDGDPFNVRRLETGLGGMSFLDCLFLPLASPSQLAVLDMGIMPILVVALVLDLARQLGLRRLWGLILAAAWTILPQPWVNLTALATGEALFIGWIALVWRQTAAPADDVAGADRPGVIALAIVAATLATLKSTFLPPIALATAMLLPLLVHRMGWRRGLPACAVGMAVACAGFLLPWMMAQYRTMGTALYPLFGRGVHATAYGFWPEHLSGMIPLSERMARSGTILLDPLVAAIGVLALPLLAVAIMRRDTVTWPLLGLLVTFLVGALIVADVTAWAATHRYIYPFVAALAVLLIVLGVRPGQPTAIRWLVCAVMIASAFAQWRIVRGGQLWYFHQWQAPALRYDEVQLQPAGWRYDLDQVRHVVHRMQERIPAGEPILARTSLPILFDFRRNPVYVPDFPGAASPAPGMPLFRGPGAVKTYLRALRIRYVVYSYGDQALFNPRTVATLGPGAGGPWFGLQVRGAYDFQTSLDGLRRSEHVIYDDGVAAVIDLGGPAVGAASFEPAGPAGPSSWR